MKQKFFFKLFSILIMVACIAGMTSTHAAAYNGDCKGKSCDDFPGNGKACESKGKSGENNPHCNHDEVKPTPPAPEPNSAPNDAEKTESDLGSISGRAWLDTNKNGLQDFITGNVPEPGLENIVVHLMNNNQIVGRTLTNELGFYSFHNLPEGEYYLIFSLSPNLAFTLQNAGNDAVDSDVNTEGETEIFSLSNSLVFDAGYIIK